MHRLQELVRLHRMGTGARRVAKLLRISPNTERQYRRALTAAELLEGPVDGLPALEDLKAAIEAHRPCRAPPEHEVSSIAKWAPRVEALRKKGLTARPIFDRLRQEDATFDGSYWAVKRLCRRLGRAEGVAPEDVAMRLPRFRGHFGYAASACLCKLASKRTGLSCPLAECLLSRL